jgi:hypothetical protein
MLTRETSSMRIATAPEPAGNSPSRPPADPAHRPTACRHCHQPIGDPLYTGPPGHCPSDVDFDCWVEMWEDRPSPEWSRMTLTLYLIGVGGFTQTEASRAADVSERTVRRWVNYLRRHPQIIFDVLSEMDPAGVRQVRHG